MGPSATYESGHFYFAQTGHSHFGSDTIMRQLARGAGRHYYAAVANQF
jgi:hypothetical protein